MRRALDPLEYTDPRHADRSHGDDQINVANVETIESCELVNNRMHAVCAHVYLVG